LIYNGNRIFFSHIDGDAIFNVSLIDRTSYSGEIILEKILRHFSDLPVTVGIITGYLNDPQYSGERENKLYKDMLSLTNIDVASHGYAHPLVWKTRKVALSIRGYKVNSEREIVGSMQDLQRLLSSVGIAKQATLFTWTGDCLPDVADAVIAAKNHILNINGGDTRFDEVNDSVSYVSPLGILKGGNLQVYTGSANENIYTNLWHGPFYGYRDVIKTFDNTESPRRLKPIDIYYHFYAGERQEALSALKSVYEYALKQDISPLRTVEYVNMVHDFYGIRILQQGPQTFHVENKGHLRTIRFDDVDSVPDMAQSSGVIGYIQKKKSLYVHLDESTAHKIVLSDRPDIKVNVESFNGWISKWNGNADAGSFNKQNWLPGKLVLAGLFANQSYEVQNGTEILKAQADAEGRLSLVFLDKNRGRHTNQVTYKRVVP
jgi:hypothetical protein